MSHGVHRVFKFGGTSVGSPEMLLRVTEVVARERSAGPLAVVVSAMGHTTDRLIEAAELAARGETAEAERIVDRLADGATATCLVVLGRIEAEASAACGERPEVTPVVREHFDELRKLLYALGLLRELTPQSLDLVLSFGERLSARLLAGLLCARGVPALFVDSRSWAVTDDRFGEASILPEPTRTRLDALRASWGGAVPVTTGFLGSTTDGRTTTLGRNGSDYTATSLARGIGAAEVVVWTDVSGVMTADPALVKDAYPLARMTYMEALELANFGASMFHPRTMVPLIESGIPMRIRSTADPAAPGTLIDGEGEADRTRPTSVTSLEELALLSVEWRSLSRAQSGGRVLQALASAGVTAWMENQAAHGQSSAVLVPEAQVGRAEAAVRAELARELARGDVEPPRVLSPVTLLTLVAEAMGRTSGVAGRFFGALGAVGVNVLASVQGASSRSVSAVIAAADTPVAVRTVHAAFNLAHQEVNLLLLGRGTVGGELLAQIASQAAALQRDHDVRLRLAGLGDSTRIALDPEGLDLGDLAAALDRAEALTGEGRLEAALDRMARLPVPVLVDCTAADRMEAVYLQAFERGMHVVAANKKPLTIPQADWARLMASARRSHRAYCYETTVGASLPVIETLKNLVRTGDRVRLVEGSFSGTLGYLTNEVMAGVPISKAVRAAREMGYTEPRPQDDLSGLDVARKALILARELGFALELADVAVEPLVPAELLAPGSVEGFLAGLEGYDGTLADQIASYRAEGRVLRYLARIDATPAEGPRLTVGPVAVPAAHPATRLRGSEAFVAFTTDRHLTYPLIVQGSGAGGAVTAAGVLADLLSISKTLRGR